MQRTPIRTEDTALGKGLGETVERSYYLMRSIAYTTMGAITGAGIGFFGGDNSLRDTLVGAGIGGVAALVYSITTFIKKK